LANEVLIGYSDVTAPARGSRKEPSEQKGDFTPAVRRPKPQAGGRVAPHIKVLTLVMWVWILLLTHFAINETPN